MPYPNYDLPGAWESVTFYDPVPFTSPYVFYMPENLQGRARYAVSSESEKGPYTAPGYGVTSTYLELSGFYTEQLDQGDPESVITRAVVIRLYPGANKLDDYNIYRNGFYNMKARIGTLSETDQRIEFTPYITYEYYVQKPEASGTGVNDYNLAGKKYHPGILHIGGPIPQIPPGYLDAYRPATGYKTGRAEGPGYISYDPQYNVVAIYYDKGQTPTGEVSFRYRATNNGDLQLRGASAEAPVEFEEGSEVYYYDDPNGLQQIDYQGGTAAENGMYIFSYASPVEVPVDPQAPAVITLYYAKESPSNTTLRIKYEDLDGNQLRPSLDGYFELSGPDPAISYAELKAYGFITRNLYHNGWFEYSSCNPDLMYDPEYETPIQYFPTDLDGKPYITLYYEKAYLVTFSYMYEDRETWEMINVKPTRNIAFKQGTTLTEYSLKTETIVSNYGEVIPDVVPDSRGGEDYILNYLNNLPLKLDADGYLIEVYYRKPSDEY